VLPIYVNAYLPPQRRMERCYAFGQAIARTVTSLGLRTVILRAAACHISRAPSDTRIRTGRGTQVLEKLAAGNLKSLIGYDEAELDDTEISNSVLGMRGRRLGERQA